MKIGITQICFPKDEPLKDILEFSKDAGYEVVETRLTDDGDIRMDSSDADLKAVRQMADDLGLELTSMVPGVSNQGSFTSPEADQRELKLEVISRMLEVCETMGIPDCLVTFGAVTEQIPYDVAYENALASCRRLAQTAEKCKVHACIEYVWGKFLVSPLEMRTFLDQVASPYINFYMDPGNMMIHGFAEQWIRILGPRVQKLHFKDFVRSTYKFVQLTEGDANWPLIMQALREIGYDDCAISEVGGDEAMMRETAEIMKKILEM